MPTPIVPLKHSLWCALGDKQVQDTLKIPNRDFAILDLIPLDERVKEACWRQLLIIPYHNGLTPPGKCSHCINGSNLTSFVKDDQIEVQNTWLEVLRDGHWTHHEDWLDGLNCPTRICQQLPNRHESALLTNLLSYNSHLSMVVMQRQTLPVRCCKQLPTQFQVFHIKVDKLLNCKLMSHLVESHQRRSCFKGLTQKALIPGRIEYFSKAWTIDFPARCRLGDESKALLPAYTHYGVEANKVS